jgi:K+-sensing histidine kinase KdpD
MTNEEKPALPPLSESCTYELHGLIEVEIDRLTRPVTGLLDATRIDA